MLWRANNTTKKVLYSPLALPPPKLNTGSSLTSTIWFSCRNVILLVSFAKALQMQLHAQQQSNGQVHT